FKKYKRLKNKSEIGISRQEKTYKRKFEEPFKEYKRVHAPENFSFIDNSEGVIEFISKLKNHFDAKVKVFVVLKKVKIISYDAIVVLLSIMVRFKATRIDFNGDFPENEEARRILN